MSGGRKQPFVFSTLGQLATIGRRDRCGQHPGHQLLRLHRVVDVADDLPDEAATAEKKLRVALDWTLDLLFSKDLVQFSTGRAPTISRAEADPGRR